MLLKGLKYRYNNNNNRIRHIDIKLYRLFLDEMKEYLLISILTRCPNLSNQIEIFAVVVFRHLGTSSATGCNTLSEFRSKVTSNSILHCIVFMKSNYVILLYQKSC